MNDAKPCTSARRRRSKRCITTSLEEHYSELAHHYSRSGNTQKAMEYLHLAGQQAVQRSAQCGSNHAPHHCPGVAQDSCQTLPSAPSKNSRCKSPWAPLLMVTKGYAAPEVEAAYTRARELCQQVGETPQLFPVLWGLRCVLSWCEESSRRRVSWGSSSSPWPRGYKTRLSSWRHYRAVGQSCSILGELVSARAHLEQGIALYDPQQHRSLAFSMAEIRGVMASPMLL